MYIYVCHTRRYNLSPLSCYSSTAAFNDCHSELMPYTALANSYGVTHTNSKTTSINDNNYSCHITAVQLVEPIIWGPYHATSLIALGADIHTQTNTYTDVCTETILETRCALACGWHAPGLIKTQNFQILL